MPTSLKEHQGSPYTVFTRAVEGFARDAFGLDLVVADLDALRPAAKEKALFIQGPDGKPEKTPYTLSSPHSPERAGAAEQALQKTLAARLLAQAQASAPDVNEAITAFSTRFAYNAAHPRFIKGNSGKETNDSSADYAGGYLAREIPDALKKAGLDIHLILLDSAATPHLRDDALRVEALNCRPLLTPSEAREAEMLRLFYAYHEVAHAADFADFQKGIGTHRGNNRDGPNHLETIGDSFAGLMLLRDYGAAAVPMLRLLAMDVAGFQQGGDAAHYTAPTLLKLANEAPRLLPDIQNATPRQLFERAQDMAETGALKYGDATRLTRYRDEVINGTAPAEKGPLERQYDEVSRVRIESLQQTRDELAASAIPVHMQSVDQGECQSKVDLLILKQLQAQGLPVPPSQKSDSPKPSSP